MRRAPTNAVVTVLMAALLTAGAVAVHAQAGDTVAHVVRPGESLYRIAQEQLEDPARWPRSRGSIASRARRSCSLDNVCCCRWR